MTREYVVHGVGGGMPLRIDYAAELNPQQLAAVTAPPGPALVLAGAGSGKTRTLTYRVAYLIERGVSPERLLLLTFTNKAAREMMGRVTELVGSEPSRLWGGTFHSIGARVLRSHAELLGYRPDFTILDREDSEALLKACVGAAGIDTKSVPFPKVEVVADLISRGTNERVGIGTLLERRRTGFEGMRGEIERVAALYAARKQAANVMDFDDLLALWLRLMDEIAEVRERYQRRFEFVMVDEYQDTNQIQSDLIDRLVGAHRHLMVVGDDSQSIYSWRGANFRNILDFPKRYPGAAIFKIETNYRSTPEILAVANAAIAANTEQFAKQLVAARKSGMKPALVPCEDAHQQAGFVAQRVVELHEEGIGLGGMAVLYRSHFHALEVQMEFTRRGIPFVITSGIRFFEQAHIKDVTAWLKWTANPADELSFKRMVLLLPGIGPRAGEKLWAAFGAAHERAKAEAGGDTAAVAPSLVAAGASAPRKSAPAWAQLTATIAQLEDPGVFGRPADMIRLVLEAFYEDYAEDTFANAAQRLEELNQLATYAGQFASLTDFLTQLSLLNNMEAEAEQRAEQDDDDRVRLSSVHQAKGLEFDVVFAIMLGEGLFPSGRSLEDASAIEEERRLFYVTVTRAKDELYLCYPLLRFTQAQGMQRLMPSRFLDEIRSDLLEVWNLRSSGLSAGAWAVPGLGGGQADDKGEDPF
jgi:DNA helicase-2/ATP-dependent DNA helicase PcrA